MRLICAIAVIFLTSLCSFAQTEAVEQMANRVTDGTASGKFIFEIIPMSEDVDEKKDFIRISTLPDKKIKIEGNNSISLATGFNHYLKYVAGIHISWNNPKQKLPEILPATDSPIYRETHLKDRYYLNYCTFSYTMPFWDEDRWMQELDWMALHGINMALSLTGMESVWKNMLEKAGYGMEDITEFIPGPSYMAWWLMNNLEGWGGPLPEEWFENRSALQKRIISRMDSLGISPIFPGFSGMMPSNAGEKMGLNIKDSGLWCGFKRPGFLSPEDSSFRKIADMYYRELTNLYGKASYYAMDPFHEGGDVTGVDLAKTGKEINDAMKRANPDAKWVIQSWQANPRKEMTEAISAGDLLILDLYSDKIPKWENIGGYGKHEWIYCMLLNFGGNVGMHGRFNNLIDGFKRASTGKFSSTLKGVGATPEGIENNPVMYELLFELPWLPQDYDYQNWINEYLEARYGQTPDENVKEAWQTLLNTVYNAPADYQGEGTVESLICARPSLNPRSASTWGSSKLFYSPDSTTKAANLLELSRPRYKENCNFLYDYIDIKRQANADEFNRMIGEFSKMIQDQRTEEARIISDQILHLMLEQDSLLSILPATRTDTWLQMADRLGGDNPETRKLYKKNAAMLITVWGDSVAANQGGLHDYSHREWGGLIRELYYPRWAAFFNHVLDNGPLPDYYKMEKEWVRSKEEE